MTVLRRAWLVSYVAVVAASVASLVSVLLIGRLPTSWWATAYVILFGAWTAVFASMTIWKKYHAQTK